MGIVIGALVGIALVLIKPEETISRLALLVFFGICMVDVAKELDWVNQRDVELSIVHGPRDSQSMSTVRLGFALLVAVLATVAFGVVTWPPKERITSFPLNQTIPAPVSGSPSHQLQGAYCHLLVL
jgi:hypothetical protein